MEQVSTQVEEANRSASADGVSSSSASAEGGVSFLSTLAAPWQILSPSRAARNMVSGSRWAFWVSFGLGVLLLAMVIVWLATWGATVSEIWGDDADLRVLERSMAEVWRDWHAGGWIGPSELIVGGVIPGLPFLAAVAAWLYLPSVHRGGSVWQSYKRSFGAVASGIGLLVIVIASAGVPLVVASNLEDQAAGRTITPGIGPQMLGMAASLLGASVLLYWLGRAALAIAGSAVAADLAPRCEGCGYDLTHRAADDRCTECGMSIAASLVPRLRRPGCAWQARRSFASWLSTAVTVVCSPAKFYEGLMLRRPDHESRRFAVWHYPVIACLAAAWLLCIAIQTGGSTLEWFLLVIVPAFIGLLAALAGWCVHRLVGAMMTSWAIVRGALPDVTWAARVMGYETAFLWAFCLYDGLLMTSFMLYGNWISEHVLASIMVGNQFGIPAEPLAILFGNAAIIATWTWRYVIAFRCVRWSNF